MSRIITRALPLAVVAVIAMGVSDALAHVTLLSSSPASNATVGRAPSSVSLTFSGPIRSGTLSVTGPGGTKVSVGAGGRDPRNIDRLLVALKSGLKPGRYTAHGSTIAADTHHQTWTLSFTLKK
ncbi:MAG TPA: copper resistance protein CopC [Solirubrobacteraceae bacterium]|nr:copper resistance protein CopC [Solirubrobacteraceae bacterium]